LVNICVINNESYQSNLAKVTGCTSSATMEIQYANLLYMYNYINKYMQIT